MSNPIGTMGDKIKTRKRPRHGTQCVFQYQQTETQDNPHKKFKISVFGPRSYNSLPKYMRDIENSETEKFKLEPYKFLELIPDEPKLCHRCKKQQHPRPAISS